MSIGKGESRPGGYRRRFYRPDGGLSPQFAFEVHAAESDLWISGVEPQYKGLALNRLLHYRGQLEAFLARHPDWGGSLVPVEAAAYPPAPKLLRSMMAAAALTGVGPMAAVAGALAEAVGRDLPAASGMVVVENGGDVFLAGSRVYTLGVFAGNSPLSGRLGVRLTGSAPFACGVCTSSASVGHSLSFGRADAVTIVAEDAALADAAATALANLVHGKRDLGRVVEKALAWPGVSAALAIMDDDLATGGNLELIEI